ncbi:hypothetical protein ACFQQB_22035 [Nonomuraea rubra]|uniref:hypothetical protein n=1 Tax=Nonomuraea rubra TaxID=46180 RepID=UPI00361CB260
MSRRPSCQHRNVRLPGNIDTPWACACVGAIKTEVIRTRTAVIAADLKNFMGIPLR